MNKDIIIYKSIHEELEEIFDNCWDVSYGPDGGESYFSTSSAIELSANKIKEITLEYNNWYGKRLENWIDSPISFPEVEGSHENLYDIFLEERYGNKKS